jgi:hypothetical protein
MDYWVPTKYISVLTWLSNNIIIDTLSEGYIKQINKIFKDYQITEEIQYKFPLYINPFSFGQIYACFGEFH